LLVVNSGLLNVQFVHHHPVSPCLQKHLTIRSSGRLTAPLTSNVRHIRMRLTPEVLVALAAALVVAVVLLFLRARAARNRGSQRPVSRGPANLRFVCAGCEGQFNHTRRTLGAWEKGTRRFYCNACHTKWRGSHPAQLAQSNSTQSAGAGAGGSRREERAPDGGSFSASRRDLQPARSGSGGGCLGAAILLVAVPVALAFVVAQYA
jgi:hypothetical protein